MRGDEIVSRSFMLKRMSVHAHFYLTNYPMLRDTCRLEETLNYMDRDMQRGFLLLADIAKGESTIEKRTVSYAVTFEVFATPWDHLKYRAKVGRLWIPKWLRNRITIRYQKVSKEASLTVPVTTIRCCPHVNENWGDRMDLHVSFIKPLEWASAMRKD